MTKNNGNDMDVDKIRQKFPFLASEPTPIYFDNAATTQKPQVVLDAVSDYYRNHNGNPGRGHHRFARDATTMYETARVQVQKFIHARYPEEIVFTRNTTESLNLAAALIGRQLKKDDVILISRSEHHSNLLPWLKLKDEVGVRIEYLPINNFYQIDYQNVDVSSFVDRVKILAIPHISNVLGVVNPIAEIIQYFKNLNPNILTIVDAAQSAAHLPINVQTLDCDFLAFSGHKMYAPMGIGVLYIKKELADTLEPVLLGGGMIEDVSFTTYTAAKTPTKFEAGTPNVAGAVGLAAAVRFINEVGFVAITAHEDELTKYLLDKLRNLDINGLKTHTNGSNHQTGIVSFEIAGIASEDIATFLDEDQIMVRSGKHCAYPLHDEIIKSPGTVRISFGIYNTKAEIDRLINSLKNAYQLLHNQFCG